MSVTDMGIADTLLTSYYPESNEIHDDKKVMIEDILLPHTSNFSMGPVEAHDVNVPPQYCFYIVGNDKKSVGWLKENVKLIHKLYLKHLLNEKSWVLPLLVMVLLFLMLIVQI